MIESFVRNPVKVTVGVLLVALFGILAFAKMPKQLTPEVETPILSIETRWPGASPQEIEREIVQEQEEQLKSVEGLVKMTSECMDSEGRITLEFVVGTDIDDAMLKANTRLQQVREYPIDALEPMIQTRSVSDQPIARFVLMAKPPSKDEIAAFQQSHPQLKADLDPVLHAMNPALRGYRLLELHAAKGKEFPELDELLPPEIDLRTLRKFTEDVIEARFERVSRSVERRSSRRPGRRTPGRRRSRKVGGTIADNPRCAQRAAAARTRTRRAAIFGKANAAGS